MCASHCCCYENWNQNVADPLEWGGEVEWYHCARISYSLMMVDGAQNLKEWTPFVPRLCHFHVSSSTLLLSHAIATAFSSLETYSIFSWWCKVFNYVSSLFFMLIQCCYWNWDRKKIVSTTTRSNFSVSMVKKIPGKLFSFFFWEISFHLIFFLPFFSANKFHIKG